MVLHKCFTLDNIEQLQYSMRNVLHVFVDRKTNEIKDIIVTKDFAYNFKSNSKTIVVMLNPMPFYICVRRRDGEWYIDKKLFVDYVKDCIKHNTKVV